jgi:hypothetical protein
MDNKGSIVEPLTRIVMFIASGVLVGIGIDASTVNGVLTHPEVVGAVTAAVTAAWYAAAKWFGRKT